MRDANDIIWGCFVLQDSDCVARGDKSQAELLASGDGHRWIIAGLLALISGAERGNACLHPAAHNRSTRVSH